MGLAVDGGEMGRHAISPAAAAVSACASDVAGLVASGGEGVLPLLRLRHTVSPAAAEVCPGGCVPYVVGLNMDGGGVLPLLCVSPAAAAFSSSIPIVARGETAGLLLLAMLLLQLLLLLTMLLLQLLLLLVLLHVIHTSWPRDVVTTPARACNDGGNPTLFIVFLVE